MTATLATLQPTHRDRSLRARAWRVAEWVAAPLLPPHTLDVISPLHPGADLKGRIVAIRAETPDAATVLIRPGGSWRGHVPGQYVRVGVDIDGVRQWRAYSLTSQLERPDGLISITTKVIPGGVVSTHLVRHARPGTLVALDQATGDFVLPDPRPAKVLFVTAGSGITPVMGMLRNQLDELPDVVLHHSAPTRDDVVFGAELRALAEADRMRLVERATDTEGMLAVADLPTLVPDWAERETWACGPLPMIDALETFWDAAGIAERLHTERFRPHLHATGEGGTITFVGSGTVVDGDGGRPILESAEDAGLLLPHGCRMGICYQCVLPLRDGAVRDLRTGELTYAAPGDGIGVQTCVSAPAGPCEIEH